MRIKNLVQTLALSFFATGVLCAQSSSPIFLGIISSARDQSVLLYSTYPETIKDSHVAYLRMEQGEYSCCFKIGNIIHRSSESLVQDKAKNLINTYELTKNESLTKKLSPDAMVFGAALKRGTLITKVDDSNYAVTYRNRKARLRMCTSIESIHFYFHEEGTENPMIHLYYPLDYGVEPSCEEVIQALQQKPSKP